MYIPNTHNIYIHIHTRLIFKRHSTNSNLAHLSRFLFASSTILPKNKRSKLEGKASCIVRQYSLLLLSVHLCPPPTSMAGHKRVCIYLVAHKPLFSLRTGLEWCNARELSKASIRKKSKTLYLYIFINIRTQKLLGNF